MNAYNNSVLDGDPSGLIESCDICNAIIYNYEWIGEMAFVTEDGHIICIDCQIALLKNLND